MGKIIKNALWVIVNNGNITQICDSEGQPVKQCCTVKDSQKLTVTGSKNQLNRLDVSFYVNVAPSTEEMNRMIEELYNA